MKITKYLLACSLISNISYAKEIEGNIYVNNYLENVASYEDHSGATLNPSKQEKSDFYAEAEAEFRIPIKEKISIQNSWHLLNMQPRAEGKDRIYDDQGIALDELFFEFKDDDSVLFVGKYNPGYGDAWRKDIKSGIWGSDFAEKYKLVGKIGLGGKTLLDLDDYGKHEISLSGFYNDDSDLNDTIFTRRDLVKSDKGKAGDTKSISSYVFNIKGKEIYSFAELGYNFSYRNIKSGKTSQRISDEDGVALALSGKFTFFDKLTMQPYYEYNKISNFNSVNNKFNPEFGDDRLPGDYKFNNYFLIFSYEKIDLNLIRITQTQTYSNKTYKIKQSEYSLTYNLKDNLSFSLGKKSFKEKNGIKSTTMGGMISYNVKF